MRVRILLVFCFFEIVYVDEGIDCDVLDIFFFCYFYQRLEVLCMDGFMVFYFVDGGRDDIKEVCDFSVFVEGVYYGFNIFGCFFNILYVY